MNKWLSLDVQIERSNGDEEMIESLCNAIFELAVDMTEDHPHDIYVAATLCGDPPDWASEETP